MSSLDPDHEESVLTDLATHTWELLREKRPEETGQFKRCLKAQVLDSVAVHLIWHRNVEGRTTARAGIIAPGSIVSGQLFVFRYAALFGDDPMAYPEVSGAMLVVHEVASGSAAVFARLIPPATFWPPPDASLRMVDMISSEHDAARRGICTSGTVLHPIEAQGGNPFVLTIDETSHQVQCTKGRFMMKMMPHESPGFIGIRASGMDLIREGEHIDDPAEGAVIGYALPALRMFQRLEGRRGVGVCGEMRHGRYSSLVCASGVLSSTTRSDSVGSDAFGELSCYAEDSDS
ncbi:MAG: hypothetical protein ABL309_07770 [Phycisphaerales bacterium]